MSVVLLDRAKSGAGKIRLRVPSRQPFVPNRRVALTDESSASQIQKGVFTYGRAGEKIPIPVDSVSEISDFKRGFLPKELGNKPLTYLNKDLWVSDGHGVHKPGVVWKPTRFQFHAKALAWLRDNVNRNIPHLYYLAVLGHDVHVSSWSELYGRHWHQGWANPFNPDELIGTIDPTFETFFKTHYVEHECDLPVCPRDEGITLEDLQSRVGFIEELGYLSGNKVTDAFVSEIIDELVSATSSEFADFDYHEVGTDDTAEDNNDTALGTSTGIARATGSPTDNDPIFTTVATITADASETWEEEGVFNNTSGPAMMDRNLTGGQAVNSSDQVQYTYNHTENPES